MQSHNDGASRLFLSADLVGSTARKQTNLDEWLADLLGFYQQFPVMVEENFTEARDGYSVELDGEVPRPELWKAVGDELIFSCVIRNEHHVHLAVKGFVAALAQWSGRVLTKKEALPLKGGAWLATFPLPDRAVAVISNTRALPTQLFDPDRAPEHNNRNLLTAIEADQYTKVIWMDFVGPSMDTGFRVIANATPRRFMLSLEAAWLYAEAAGSSADGELFLEGEIQMKGVWGGRGYPLFWLDTKHQHSGQPMLDQILGTKPSSPALVCELARALCTGDDGWVTKIYVPDSKTVALKTHHAQIEEEVTRLLQVEDTQGEVPEL